MTKEYNGFKIVGNLDDLFRTIDKVAPTNATTLITGESGTGKELVARAISYESLRSSEPLVVVNCGAIPAELLESTLYGHVKGAFTGATSDRVGKFEQANGGTIFLDEIGDMSLDLQVKLLRALQFGEYEKVGDTDTYRTDVRVIAATNQDLGSMMEEGKFRKDLFYRLNVIPIQIPPLRDRIGDVPELTEHFVNKYLKEDESVKEPISIYWGEGPAKPVPEGETAVIIDSAFKSALLDYSWPGNVRELESAIEHAIIMCEDNTLRRDDLPFNILASEELNIPVSELRAAGNYDPRVREFAEYVVAGRGLDRASDEVMACVLKMQEGNMTEAAKALGIGRATIYRRLHDLRERTRK